MKYTLYLNQCQSPNPAVNSAQPVNMPKGRTIRPDITKPNLANEVIPLPLRRKPTISNIIPIAMIGIES